MKQSDYLDKVASKALWESFQNGDQEAYTQLYHLHIRAMHRYGVSLVASEAFVLDCIHDVFAEIWDKRTRLSIPENTRFYLLKAVKTRIMHQLERKERTFKPLSDINDTIFEASDLEILEELENAKSRQDRLKILITQLPTRQQEALKLRFIENLDYNQIGNVLEVNTQSAKNLVFRAIEKLRGWIILPIINFCLYFFA